MNGGRISRAYKQINGFSTSNLQFSVAPYDKNNFFRGSGSDSDTNTMKIQGK